MEYYYADGGTQHGPVPVADMARLGVRGDMLVWREGMPGWVRADEIPEVRAALAAGPGHEAGASASPDAGSVATSAGEPYAGQAYPAENSYAQPAYGNAPYGQPQYPASPYGPPLNYGHGQYSGQPSTGLAMTSMILGIAAIPVSFVIGCLGIPCAIAAIITGHMARARIRRGQAAGAGMALTGLIMGYVTVFLTVAFIIFFIGIFVIGSQQ